MIERRCQDCAWWEAKPREKSAHTEGYGECRRSAPQSGGWPVAKATEWCGDFFYREAERMKRETGS